MPVSTLCLSLLLASANAQDASDNDSTVTFPAAYFAEYVPLTVNDMVNRIPGIALILGTGNPNNSGDRGLGSSAQILIDDRRLAGKANEASNQLNRIAANEVDYIQIIRCSSSDLDAQNSCQIVNIVLLEAQSRSSISSEVNAIRYADSTLSPAARLRGVGRQEN